MKGALAFSPYELVLAEIEKGNVNPFEVDLEHIIKIFEEKAKELEERELFLEAGVFLLVATKLLKLKLRYLFPEPKRERKRITIEEVKEVVKEAEEEADFLEWLYDYSPSVGRPKGSRVVKPQKMDFKEFFKKEIPLHKEVDWYKEARRVYEEIKRGVFRIRNISDFIAFLFAYQEFEDIYFEPEKLL
ncbi:ScpA family protein [Aquifex pyrophilus]